MHDQLEQASTADASVVSGAPTAIPYRPLTDQEKARFRRRRIARVAAVVAVAAALALAAVRLWLPAQLAWHHRRCLVYTPPADAVVCRLAPDDGSSIRGPELVRTGSGSRQSFTSPAPWAALCSMMGFGVEPRSTGASGLGLGSFKVISRLAGTAFLGERETPGGRSRLVAVDVMAPPDGGEWLAVCFAASVLSGREGLRTPRAINVEALNEPILVVPRASTVTVFAGASDPSDESKFTFTVRIDDTVDVFEGRLTDSDTVVIRPRNLVMDDTGHVFLEARKDPRTRAKQPVGGATTRP